MSSNSTTTLVILQFQLVTQYLAITVGFVLFIGGSVGNLVNIAVLFSLGNWKHNACSLYMLVKSIMDLFLLFVGLFMQTLIFGFKIDLTTKSRVWCKLRLPLIDIWFLVSLTCICLQSIGAFFCSSRSVVLRQKSNIRTARKLIIGSLLIWTLHGIPYLVLQDLVNRAGTYVCIGTNSIQTQYNTYFVTLGLNVGISITVITVLRCLTYRNIRMISMQENRSLSALTRQMRRIALFQVVILLLFQGAYGIVQVYCAATASLTKDSYRQAQEAVTRNFSYTYVYGSFACNFYCCCAASKRYREQVLNVLKQLLPIRRRNQVQPLSQTIRISRQHATHV